MIAHRNLLKDIGRLIFWFPVRWCVGLLGFGAVHRLGGFLGAVDYLLLGRRSARRIAANIADALGCDPKRARRIARLNLQSHYRNVLELIKYPRIGRDEISQLLQYEHLDRLKSCLDVKKGVILLTAHFGAKQLVQLALGLEGYHVYQIHYHMQAEELSWVQKNISQRHRVKIEGQIPVTFIPADGFKRAAYRCLKDNHVLIIAGDGSGIKGRMDQSYRPFEFLGKQMLFPTGAISLAKRTGAAVVPAFVVRDDYRHRVVFEQPLVLGDEPDEHAVRAYVDLLEKQVRRCPHLWEFWEEFEPGNLIAVEETPAQSDVT